MVRRLLIEDLRLVRMVHDLNVDVDGSILAFTVSKIADSLEDYERNVWVYDGKTLRQITRGGNNDFSPRILGGKGLVFLSRRGGLVGTSQVLRFGICRLMVVSP